MTTAYERYRINVTGVQNPGELLGCGALQFKKVAGGADILNTASPSSGTATASSTYGGYPASDAFTGLIGSTGWLNGGGETGWLAWDTGGAGIDVTGFVLCARVNEPSRAPNTFNLEYSDDGAAWSVATAYSGQSSWGNTEARYFASPSVGSHRYWRINVASANGGGYVGIGCLCLGTAAGDAIITDASGRKALIDSQSAYGGYPVVNIAQRNPSSYFVSANGVPQWIDVYLPEAEVLAEIDWTVHPGEQGRAPTDFTLAGWNGTGWDVLMTVEGSGGWASGETRAFVIGAVAPALQISKAAVYVVEGETLPALQVSKAAAYVLEGSNERMFTSKAAAYVVIGPPPFVKRLGVAVF